MPETLYRGRQAAYLENEHVRVTVLREGGHIAELLARSSGVNPLWTPGWPTIEPSTYDPQRHPEYGGGGDARLLAGLMGHNLCLDMFGGPSAAEAAAGLGVHGEGSNATYELSEAGGELRMRGDFRLSAMRVERRLELHGAWVRIRETVESLAAFDRPMGWTQHVTLGPPFVENGVTQIRTAATRSMVFPGVFSPADDLVEGAEFRWPQAPARGGGTRDLSGFTPARVSGAYTVHLMDPAREHGWFTAYSPRLRTMCGYVWRRADFPWMGMWEENRSRPNPPWNGAAVTQGMEFGASPFPETRREMVDRGSLFGVPGFRWLPARGRLEAEYWATVAPAELAPAGPLAWPGN